MVVTTGMSLRHGEISMPVLFVERMKNNAIVAAAESIIKGPLKLLYFQGHMGVAIS